MKFKKFVVEVLVSEHGIDKKDYVDLCRDALTVKGLKNLIETGIEELGNAKRKINIVRQIDVRVFRLPISEKGVWK